VLQAEKLKVVEDLMGYVADPSKFQKLLLKIPEEDRFRVTNCLSVTHFSSGGTVGWLARFVDSKQYAVNHLHN
jgi:hypothetical protein